MIKVSVTARELLDQGAWLKACELLGISEWAVNEGQMDGDDVVELTIDQAVTLGLVGLPDA